MRGRAILRHLRSSPRKVRLVVDQIRGKSVEEALGILTFSTKGAMRPVQKTLRSAVANALSAETSAQVSPEAFRIVEACVDEGRTMRRFRPRAYGRASRIRKRSCHVHIVVSDEALS